MASLLVSRGCAGADSARRFLNPSSDQLHDPNLMLGMTAAVERVQRAIADHEPILIYGDYDVDGTTGAVVLRRVLKLLGATTDFHIPHRFTEGYGIQQPRLEQAHADGIRLVISVDCGIRAHDPLIWAKKNGLDVIVTDHHLPDDDEGAPPAFCVLNPNQRGCNYPDKNLAGVGVAYKLTHALLRAAGREHLADGFLKMAAIGTVADVARLTGENRSIVALGLSDLPAAVNPGLRALMRVVGFKPGEKMTAYDLGFRIGPRINAAGRMDAGRAIVELFEAATFEDALQRANILDARYRERQEVQREIVQFALDEWERNSHDQTHVAVIAGDGWHRGVIGIAASKIAEKLGRPCVVISMEGDLGHGSARSIEPYDLLSGITVCGDLFQKFGGHSQAAGLTIERQHLPEFRRRLNDHARENLSDDDLKPVVNLDAEVKSADVTPELLMDIAKLEPFGAGNPRPILATHDFRLITSPRVIKDKHLKLTVGGRGRGYLDAIWWDGVERSTGAPLTAGANIALAYSLESNFWQGESRLQLNVKD
ncbi:MAG: single-stranded-DNA-specific exonuclease RecJ, partial [Pyrinomonadaceae bacterium]